MKEKPRRKTPHTGAFEKRLGSYHDEEAYLYGAGSGGAAGKNTAILNGTQRVADAEEVAKG